jgi:hypothetical protein
MYNDGDEVVYTVHLPQQPSSAAPGADASTQPGVALRIQQTMDAEDMCAIFDDAWLGSRVWEATTSFCDRLCGSNGQPPLVADLAGSSVLELGAGTGIGGMVAAALGARDVVTTDMASPAGTLNLIRHNIEANLPGITDSARLATRSAASDDTVAPTVRGAALDWTQPLSDSWRAEFEPADGFDTILAAECIYTGIDAGSAEKQLEKRPVWTALAETISSLAQAKTSVYVCSKERGMKLQSEAEQGGGGSMTAGKPEMVPDAPSDTLDDGNNLCDSLGDGSLVVQFTRHMEAERGFVVQTICQPVPGSVQGLWCAPVSKRNHVL